jgi:type 1 glutamine amidotransferase
MNAQFSIKSYLLSAFALFGLAYSLPAQDTLIHYTETTGYNHGTAAVSLALFQEIGQEQGFVVLQDGDGSLFNKATLSQAKVVVFSNTSGNSGLTLEQRGALEWFVDTLGRHLLGIHAASDTYRHSTANGGNQGSWDWYAETLGGSVQTGPNHTSSSHVDTIFLVQEHPAADNIDFPWIKEEEYYYWENGYLNPDIQTIMEVGETGDNSYDEQRPVAWFRTNPQGAKVFYTSLGHKQGNFTGNFPEFEQLLSDAVAWLLDCPSDMVEQDASICEGESYAFGHELLSEAGEYSLTLQNAQDCDSTIQLTLDVFPPDLTQISASICEGENHAFGDEQLTEAGEYSLTLQNAQGCDSTIQLTLDVFPPDLTQISAAICEGESYALGEELLTEAGEYSLTLQNTQGCDSTIQLTLEITEVDVAVVQDDNTLTAAEGAAAYQWLDCDNNNEPVSGATGHSFTPAVNGNYAVRITTAEGCTGISDCFNVMVVGNRETIALPEITLYPNPAHNALTVDFKSELREVSIEICTLEGRKIREAKSTFAERIEIDLTAIPGGLYLLKVHSSKGGRWLKFLKM